MDVVHELGAEAGTAISWPADSAYQMSGSRFPSGPIGGQPGPLMWPG